MTDQFDPFTRHRAARRVERRAGMVLLLLGFAGFALTISYLTRIAGAGLAAVVAGAIG
jgi:hypothetical protein